MIRNPTVGMRTIVFWPSSSFHNKIGTIISIHGYNTVKVKLDNDLHYYFDTCWLTEKSLTIEEQDKLNREKHADKYL